MQNSFLFDINRCTACKTCVVACVNENKATFGNSTEKWRKVYSIRNTQEKEIVKFNLSLSCSHCADAPCVEKCPSKAYSRNSETGAVVHTAELCTGCKQCMWACPFDAVVFDEKQGIVSKCNWCDNRLKAGNKPACAALCPTGALDFKKIDEDHDLQQIPGFPETKAKPKIKFLTPFKKENVIYSNSEIVNEEKTQISLQQEWKMLLFCLLTAVSVSVYSSSIFAESVLPSYLFLPIGILGGLLRILQMGKSKRFIFSLMNLKSSWISKEMLFLAVFLVGASIETFVFPAKLPAKIIIALTGMFSLFSTDNYYSILKNKYSFYFHSGSVLNIGIYLSLVFLANYTIFIFAAIVKLFIFLHRRIYLVTNNWAKISFLDLFRIVLGFVVPVYLWFENPSYGLLLYTISILSGEIIDRIEFYKELENQK